MKWNLVEVLSVNTSRSQKIIKVSFLKRGAFPPCHAYGSQGLHVLLPPLAAPPPVLYIGINEMYCVFLDPRLSHRSRTWRRDERGSIALRTISAASLFGNICQTLIEQQAMYEGTIASETIAESVLQSLIESGDYNTENTYALIDTPCYNPMFHVISLYNKANSYAKGRPWWKTSIDKNSWQGIYYYRLGINLPMCSEEQYNQLLAKGDYIAVMDADMQDPPSLLLEMVNLIESDEYDSVATRRVDRKGEPPVRSWFAKRFYQIINDISDTDIVDGARDFRLMKKAMVDAIVEISEYNRFSKGIFGWIGFRTYWLPYENVERVAGKTKWSFWKLFQYAVDGIINFSNVPLNIASWFGIFMTVVSFVVLGVVVLRRLFWGDPVAGWASTICVIIFIGGIQLLCLGIMGQYIAKTYMETKHRPHYTFVNGLAREISKKIRLMENIPDIIKEELVKFSDKSNQDIRLAEIFDCFSEWCEQSERPIVLIIDEVDTATNNQVFLDFLVDMSFSIEDIARMLKEYENDYHTNMDIGQMSKMLYDDTSGDPYLVARLCKFMDERIAGSKDFPNRGTAWTKDRFLRAVNMLLEDSNPLLDSLMNKLEQFPELNAVILQLLFEGTGQ